MNRKAYHHGNLREALLEAAGELLREGGVEGLSLRKVAQRAGVHPSQVEPANDVWAPDDDEVEYSRRVIEAFETAEAEGVGVVTVDGRMVENLHRDNARRVLAALEVAKLVVEAVGCPVPACDPLLYARDCATGGGHDADVPAEALRAGKHVYVEKPLADTPEKVEAVVAAQEESGKYAAVGFNRRMAPAYRKAKEIIDADGAAKNLH